MCKSFWKDKIRKTKTSIPITFDDSTGTQYKT